MIKIEQVETELDHFYNQAIHDQHWLTITAQQNRSPQIHEFHRNEGYISGAKIIKFVLAPQHTMYTECTPVFI